MSNESFLNFIEKILFNESITIKMLQETKATLRKFQIQSPHRRTFKDALNEGNRCHGFDALRIGLATWILIVHSVAVCSSNQDGAFYRLWTNPLINPFGKMILPIFFCMTGYLVTGSAYRVRSLFIFFLYRALRIVPALMVEVFISAVILGGILTTRSKFDYFTDPQFFKYFLNIIGNVQFYLPGVFESNPNRIVNVNLWTLPPELHCYAILAVMMMTGIMFNRKWYLAIFLVGSAAVTYLLPSWSWGDTGGPFIRTELIGFSCFVGVLFYIFSDKIPLSKVWFALSIGGLFFFNSKYTIILGVLSSCYLCMYIGFLDLRNFPLVKRGDLSYGVYLYGYPLQQTVWLTCPFARHWWLLFLLAYLMTLIVSDISWRMIEKPALGLKRYFKKPLLSPL